MAFLKPFFFLFLGLIFSIGSFAQGTTHWWNDAVFYEIFVRSFYDSNGDGIGDFAGLTSQLDYLNDGDPNTDDDLGITAIWLMPINPSPSYHGYDVTDYYGIHPDYGTKQDFLHFMDQAHQRGIKVVVDFVMNHSSSAHPWFQQAKNNDPFYRDFYRWSNTDPGYNGPWGQQVWHYNNTAGEYYYGVFWGGMPDLNYGYAPVKDSIFAVTEYWLNDMNVDGFRCDAVKFIFEDGSTLENTNQTLQFWQEWNTVYKAASPDAMAVGEAWDNTGVVLGYVGDKFDYCFEFDLAGSILGAVNSSNPSGLRGTIQNAYDNYPYLQFGTFLTNHDQERSFDVFQEDEEKMKRAAAIYLTLPGVPYIYYGEEVGMKGKKPDENIRRPMQWSADPNGGFTFGTPWNNLNSNYTFYNVAVMEPDPNSILNWYKKLISIRNDEVALRQGTYLEVDAGANPVMAYLRQHQGETVMVLVNTGNQDYPNLQVDLNGSGLPTGDYIWWELTNDREEIPANIDGSQMLTGISLAPGESKVLKFGWPVGQEQLSAGGNTILFPNPVVDQLTLRFEQRNADRQYELIDLQGRVLQAGQVPDREEFQLDLSALPQGAYVLQVSSNQPVERFKVLKQ